MLEAGLPGGSVTELRLLVPNRPGIVAQVALALGRAGVNIADMALSPAADMRSGSMTLWVAGEDDAMRAKQLHGIVVQNPFNMGYLGVRTMVEQLQGKPVEKRIDTGVTMITPDNLEAAETQALLHPPLDQYLK